MDQANQYEMNEGDNFHFAVDKSGSMQANDCVLEGRKVSRDTRAKAKAIEYIKAGAKYDKDGTTVLAFGSDVVVYDGVTPEKAEEIIGKIKAQDSATRTDLVIKKSYELHLAGGYEQTVLFLVTDGEPTGIPNAQEEVKKVIREIAADVAERGKGKGPGGSDDEHGYAISFVTSGIRSEGLNAFLTDIDDNLGAVIDIVDVKDIEEVGSLERAFAGALHD